MNLFCAAVYTNNYCRGQKQYDFFTEQERAHVDAVPHILESFHYVGKQKFVDEMRANGAKVFLDSGAFSAYTLGVELSVPVYCDYIKRNSDIIRVEDGSLMASVLDGIGDPLQTYRNQLWMESLGVRPLPCFHANEDERYLEHYVKNYEYITLGGMVGASSQQLMNWLDRIWDRYLCDSSGRPRCKVHGFGITAVPIMKAYPWWSCDSSSWIQSTSFGTIVTPDWGPVAVSDKSPSRHDAGQHITTFTEVERQAIIAKLAQQGYDWERLATVYQSRAAYNLWAYCQLNDRMNAENDYTRLTRIKQELF